MVCEAFLNPSEFNDIILPFFLIWIQLAVYIPWDVEEYYIKHVKGRKDKERLKFPNPDFGAFSKPLTVVDSKGRIVLWYLPRLLSSEQQAGFLSLRLIQLIKNFKLVGRSLIHRKHSSLVEKVHQEREG